MPKDKTPAGRLYQKRTRWYADFRDFADVGGKLEAMIPDGSRSATEDRDVAERLAGERLEELQQKKRSKDLHGIQSPKTLGEFAAYHLRQKERKGDFSARYLATFRTHLEAAVAYFGADRPLELVGPKDVQKWINKLRETDNGRGGTMSEATVREYLNALSNTYKRAIAEEYVPTDHNPAAAVFDKPSPEMSEASWLEVEDAALLLEAARKPLAYGPGFMHALIATFLLTGARKSEVLGLKVEDVSFDARNIHIRPNEYRRLKTKRAKRTVPLFGHLEEVLREHIYGGDSPRVSGLLFPSPKTGEMLTSIDKSLDAIGARVGWEPKDIRCHGFRHTYAAFRLQTLDHGAPISPWTVANELGHRRVSLIEERYGHVGARKRLPEPDYRPDTLRDWWEQQAAQYEADAAKAREKDPNRAALAARQAEEIRGSATEFLQRVEAARG